MRGRPCSRFGVSTIIWDAAPAVMGTGFLHGRLHSRFRGTRGRVWLSVLKFRWSMGAQLVVGWAESNFAHRGRAEGALAQHKVLLVALEPVFGVDFGRGLGFTGALEAPCGGPTLVVTPGRRKGISATTVAAMHEAERPRHTEGLMFAVVLVVVAAVDSMWAVDERPRLQPRAGVELRRGTSGEGAILQLGVGVLRRPRLTLCVCRGSE